MQGLPIIRNAINFIVSCVYRPYTIMIGEEIPIICKCVQKESIGHI